MDFQTILTLYIDKYLTCRYEVPEVNSRVWMRYVTALELNPKGIATKKVKLPTCSKM